MVSKKEVMGLELKRIPHDIQCMNSVLRPLAPLDENTCKDVHADLQNFSTAENRSWPLLNKRHMDESDNLVKATFTWKPFGDNVKDETNEHRFSVATGIISQNWKSLAMTNLYRKTTQCEKENMESASEWTGGSLDFPPSGPADGKRLQLDFEAVSKPVTKLESKVVDEMKEAVDGPCLSIGDDELTNECKAIAQNLPAGPSKAIVGKSKGFNLRKGESDFKAEDCLRFGPDRSVQTSITDSRQHAQPLISSNMEISCGVCVESIQSMKAPLVSLSQDGSYERSFHFTQMPDAANACLLSQLESQKDPTQIFEEHVCDMWQHCPMTTKTSQHDKFRAQNMGAHSCNLMRPELSKTPVLSQSESISIQDSPACEEITTGHNDHFVILFSEQNTLNGGTGRIIKRELLKFSSLCAQYSRKILSSMTSLVREQTIKQSLRRLQQIFKSPPRGFVKLNSQKLPEFSSNASSAASNRKLAEDKELKAVLMKINEVFISMEKTSPANLQVTYANFNSPPEVKREASFIITT